MEVVWYSTVLEADVKWLLLGVELLVLGLPENLNCFCSLSASTWISDFASTSWEMFEEASAKVSLMSWLTPIRLPACLLGILLFTEELIFVKVHCWHGSHSRVRPVLTLITPPPAGGALGTGAAESSSGGWMMKLWRKKLPNAKQFPPLAASSTPTSCSEKLEAASCQSWSLNQSRRAVLRSRPRAICKQADSSEAKCNI